MNLAAINSQNDGLADIPEKANRGITILKVYTEDTMKPGRHKQDNKSKLHAISSKLTVINGRKKVPPNPCSGDWLSQVLHRTETKYRKTGITMSHD